MTIHTELRSYLIKSLSLFTKFQLALVGVFFVASIGFISFHSSAAYATVTCPIDYSWNGTECERVEETPKICPGGVIVNAAGDCVITRSVVYDNTQGVPIPNQQVTDPLFSPQNGWQLVPGSIRNSYNGTQVVLADSLYTQNGLIAAPSAGLYGQPNDLTNGTLQIPWRDTLYNFGCLREWQNSVTGDRYISDVSSNPIASRVCNLSGQEDRVQSITLNPSVRYLNFSNCARDIENSSFRERHSGNFWRMDATPIDHRSCALADYDVTEFFSFDLLNHRYFTTRLCSREIRVGGEDALELANFYSVSNERVPNGNINDSTNPVCENQYTDSVGYFVADLLDPNAPTSGAISYAVQQAGICPTVSVENTTPFTQNPANPASCIRVLTIDALGYIPDQPEDVGQGVCTPASGSDVIIGNTVDCVFPLSGAPAGMPYIKGQLGIQARIDTADGLVECDIVVDDLVCNNIPTSGAVEGIEELFVRVNGGVDREKGNFNLIGLSAARLEELNNINCEEAPINSTTTCTFELPPDTFLPTDTQLAIGDGAMTSTCTSSNGIVTCTNVATGSFPGEQRIYALSLSQPKVETQSLTSVLPRQQVQQVLTLPRTGGANSFLTGILGLLVLLGSHQVISSLSRE